MRDALAAAVAGLRVEDPADDACRVGPLISAEARDDARGGGRARGAGGRAAASRAARRWPRPGNYLAPALVEVDDPAAELAQEEVFAPVVRGHARRPTPTPPSRSQTASATAS